MNKETIQKAAMEYAEENPWYPGETSYESDIREMEEKFADAYIAGADWRINSVWHDAETEIPRENKAVIGITGGNYCCYMGLCGETAKEICPEMAKWAYVSDLMPEGKEGGQ